VNSLTEAMQLLYQLLAEFSWPICLELKFPDIMCDLASSNEYCMLARRV
jgi:hypothetical protein